MQTSLESAAVARPRAHRSGVKLDCGTEQTHLSLPQESDIKMGVGVVRVREGATSTRKAQMANGRRNRRGAALTVPCCRWRTAAAATAASFLALGNRSAFAGRHIIGQKRCPFLSSPTNLGWKGSFVLCFSSVRHLLRRPNSLWARHRGLPLHTWEMGATGLDGLYNLRIGSVVGRTYVGGREGNVYVERVPSGVVPGNLRRISGIPARSTLVLVPLYCSYSEASALVAGSTQQPRVYWTKVGAIAVYRNRYFRSRLSSRKH